MKCVGIIGAMEQEVARLKEVMEDVSSLQEQTWTFMREFWKERKLL